MNLKEMYENNVEFKEYVDKYAANKCISVEQALEKAVVREYAEYLLKK